MICSFAVLAAALELMYRVIADRASAYCRSGSWCSPAEQFAPLPQVTSSSLPSALLLIAVVIIRAVMRREDRATVLCAGRQPKSGTEVGASLEPRHFKCQGACKSGAFRHGQPMTLDRITPLA